METDFPQRSVLVSIRPTFAAKILTGQKRVELRRRFPIRLATGAKMFIYCSSPVSAVIGFAQIKAVLQLPIAQIWRRYGNAACISRGEFDTYFSGLQCGFVIVLEGITSIHRKLRANDLYKRFGIVPPQSYRYVTQECTALLENDWVQAPCRHERDNRAGRPAARTQIAG